jgi:hypothetical protein
MPCPLSLYKERHAAPPCTHNHAIHLMQKTTRWLDVKTVTRKRPRTSINRSSLYVIIEFCVRRSPSNIAPGTPMASCRSSNTDTSLKVDFCVHKLFKSFIVDPYRPMCASRPSNGFWWLNNKTIKRLMSLMSLWIGFIRNDHIELRGATRPDEFCGKNFHHKSLFFRQKPTFVAFFNRH